MIQYKLDLWKGIRNKRASKWWYFNDRKGVSGFITLGYMKLRNMRKEHLVDC